MPFIPFTEEQKLLAARVDLPGFLHSRGVDLKRSGGEYRLASDPYITVRGSTWYDQAEQRGGNAISFVKKYYGLDYPGAMSMLLEGGGDAQPVSRPAVGSRQRKTFALPPAHSDMDWVRRYLVGFRQIPEEIFSHFTRCGMVYQGVFAARGGKTAYHNAVFVGHDENGVARHAQKRSLNTHGQSYRGNIAGSNAAYSFHHIGASDRLYVFEAPIDLMSFIALHPQDWQRHSYVALCGVAEHAMLHQLKAHTHLRSIYLCLDNDKRGIEACDRLQGILEKHGYTNVEILLPEHKDWNDVLKGGDGQAAQSRVTQQAAPVMRME